MRNTLFTSPSQTTYYPRNVRGYGHVTVFSFFSVYRDVVRPLRRAGLSATADTCTWVKRGEPRDWLGTTSLKLRICVEWDVKP